MRLLLVCSGGGHLAHLLALRRWWQRHERHWWVVEEPGARSRLVEESVSWARGPTNRSARALVRNSLAAPGVLARARPDLVLSTGAALALPAFAAARVARIPRVFVPVIDRVDRPSLTGRLVRPLASEVLVHWPEQARFFDRATVVGPLWGGP